MSPVSPVWAVFTWRPGAGNYSACRCCLCTIHDSRNIHLHRRWLNMPNVVIPDKSIHEPTVSEMHPARTTPQGTQADGVLHGHEQRDVDFGALLRWFLGLAVVIFASFFLMYVMFMQITERFAAADKPQTPFDT